MWIPEDDGRFYTFDPNQPDDQISVLHWGTFSAMNPVGRSGTDEELLARGLVFKTKEEAQEAKEEHLGLPKG